MRIRANLTLAQFIAAGTTTPKGIQLQQGQSVSLTGLTTSNR